MTTELYKQNLAVYKSQKLNTADDGGGLMTAQELNGTKNELFNPTSDIELINGGFDARLVYPAVVTEHQEKLLGAYCLVGEQPQSENINILIFPAAYYGEEYKNAKNRIEAYSAPTIESRYTLMGRALAGAKVIQMYCRPQEEEPSIGQRLCFETRTTNAAQRQYEYFRIARTSSELRTFTEANGSDFQMRVVKLELSDVLENDWQGIDYPSRNFANAATKIMETDTADAARYYSSTPLLESAQTGDKNIRINGVYAQLVPTSSEFEAQADCYPVRKEAWLPLGEYRTVFGSTYYNAVKDIYLPYLLQRGTVNLSNTYYDDGNGRLVAANGSAVEIDYKQGIIRNVPAGYYSVAGVPAACIANAANSIAIPIDQSNQQASWAFYLAPKPAATSVDISWISSGVWYSLEDRGDNKLYFNNNQVGSITRDGSCIFELPDLPDTGSKIIISWIGANSYSSIDGGDPVNTLSPISPVSEGVRLSYPDDNRPIKPSSVSLSAGGQTYHDNGQGGWLNSSNQAVNGFVSYADGAMLIKGITAANISLACERYTGAWQNSDLLLYSSPSGEITGSIGTGLAAGTFFCYLVVKTIYCETQKLYRYSGVMVSMGSNTNPYQETSDIITGDGAKARIFALTDDGAGGLLLDGQAIIGSSINYSTGVFSATISSATVPVLGDVGLLQEKVRETIADSIYEHYNKREVRGTISYDFEASTQCKFIASTASAQAQAITPTGKNSFNLLGSAPAPSYPVFNSWVFQVGNTKYYERNGNIYRSINTYTGEGEIIGRIDSRGIAEFNLDFEITNLRIVQGCYCHAQEQLFYYTGRTPEAQVVPNSFNLRLKLASDAQEISASADAAGLIEAQGLTGLIDYTTGVFELASDIPIIADSLRFNYSCQRYTPLPKSLIGIDTVRLRADGKTPVFKVGDTILIKHALKHELGTAIAGASRFELNRPNCKYIGVIDNNGKDVDTNLYEVDIPNSTIVFANNLSLAGYALPLWAVSEVSQLNRIIKADFSGALELQNPLLYDFPAGITLVCSCFVVGNLEVEFSDKFEQNTWTSVWQDSRIGEEILAKLNVADYPVELTNDGAITERWLLQFTNATSFNIIGEHLGLVARGDINSDCAPINPVSGKPYFTIPRQAFGTSGNSIWAAGNCIRFNTKGTNVPVWLIKTIQPSQTADTVEDNFRVCLRGNTVVLD